jgi:hypothetical protein
LRIVSIGGIAGIAQFRGRQTDCQAFQLDPEVKE